MKKYGFLILCFIYFKAFGDNLTLESSAFKLNSLIPEVYTCNAADKSPPLTWSNVPAKTQSFALVVQDPDAPSGEWTHWIIYNIPPTVMKLEEGAALPEGATAGKNSWNTFTYRGPCPPIGMHRYVFKLYALDKLLGLNSDASPDQVLQAITGHVIEKAELVGLYQKLK